MRFYIEEVSDVCRNDIIPYTKENGIDLKEWAVNKYDELNNIVTIKIYLHNKTNDILNFKYLIPKHDEENDIKEVCVSIFRSGKKNLDRKSITIDYSKENYRISLFKLIVSEILECYGLL